MLTNNVGGMDRALRIVVGLVLLALIFVGPQTWWGLIGIIPLVTGLIGRLSCLQPARVLDLPGEAGLAWAASPFHRSGDAIRLVVLRYCFADNDDLRRQSAFVRFDYSIKKHADLTVRTAIVAR